MKREQYFLEAMANECYRYRSWVMAAFSITKGTTKEDYPFKLDKREDGIYFKPLEGAYIKIEDADPNQRLFSFRTKVNLKSGDVPNLFEDIETTYGSILVNYVGLIYPLGGKIPFVNGEFNIKQVEEEIFKRLTTDPEFQTAKTFKHDDPIYVSEYLNFIDCILSLEGYTQLAVPSASPKSLMTDPNIEKRRNELLKEYEGKLDDPTVIAKIEAELIQMDKDWIKGDISEGFYNSGKDFDIIRKKAFLMHGYESGLGMNPDTITTPLSDGWDIEKLPAMVNSLREGSYGRGKMTGLGGYATKVVNRVLQNVKIGEDDCGVNMGWEKSVTKDNSKDFIGFYYISGNKSILINADNVKELVGKVITLRSPQFCKTSGNKFCKHCVGEPNSENENALAAYAAAVTSQLMDISMQAAHGKALKTTKFDVVSTII
ncbi:MAG: hypothetical protein IBX57_00315 [Gammaproteobacteria bacterium]|nr:hypothetical protein [Gammaproteobacteria bacterium]